MIFEMRTYQIKVGMTQRYVTQFEEKGLPIVSRYCKLVGYWTAESGPLNRVIHIWEFDSVEHRSEARARWWQDREWLDEYIPLALPLVESQESVILTAAQFSPIR